MATLKSGWLYEGRAVGEHGRGNFVPVLGDDGDVYLVDTAVLSIPSGKKDESRDDSAIRRCIELSEKNCQYAVYSIKSDYYNGEQYVRGPYRMGDELPGEFEEVFDLRDLRGIKKGVEDERWFDEGDKVRNVRLYREHGYSWSYGDIGVTLVRKGAEPLLGKKLDAARLDWKPTGPDPKRWRFDDVLKAAGDMEDAGVPMTREQQVQLAVGKEQVRQLCEWSEAYEDMCREWNRRLLYVRLADEGEAFQWSGSPDNAPEWFADAVESGDLELEPSDVDGEFDVLIHSPKVSELDQAFDGYGISGRWQSCRKPYWLFRSEERDGDGEYVWKYGCFDAEWDLSSRSASTSS